MMCKRHLWIFFLMGAIFMMALCTFVHATDITDDPRYCGEPARDVNGKIIRSAAVIAQFKRIHPCPSTGKTAGACPGWQIDHIIPLAVGGCDAILNMQYLPNAIKTCAATTGIPCKDRWERKIYAIPFVMP